MFLGIDGLPGVKGDTGDVGPKGNPGKWDSNWKLTDQGNLNHWMNGNEWEIR